MTPISQIAAEALKNLNDTVPEAIPMDWLFGLAVFSLQEPPQQTPWSGQNACPQAPIPGLPQPSAQPEPQPQASPPPRPSAANTLPDGLSLKPTADVKNLDPRLTASFPTIVKVWRDAGAPDPVITSGRDSKHMAGSKHYVGKAIDLRGNAVSDVKMRELAANLQKALGSKFRVLTEFFPTNPANDHIHVQLVE